MNKHIPNILSFSRIIISPLLCYLIYNNMYWCFNFLLPICLLTDFLDGYIARKYNLVSDLGARLDSYADFSLSLSCLITIIIEQPHLNIIMYMISSFFAYISSYIFSYHKFKKINYYHTYTSKLSLALGMCSYLYYMMYECNIICIQFLLALICISSFEDIIISSLIKEPQNDIKSVFTLLFNKLKK